MLALKLDDERLTPEHGGPVRFVGPAHLRAYKGVKWLVRVLFVDHLQPGFWESKVNDVEGGVPEAVMAVFDHDRTMRMPARLAWPVSCPDRDTYLAGSRWA